MADPDRSPCVPLRKPLAAQLTDRHARLRLAVTIVALAPDRLRFIADRSLPPGTSWTIVVRRWPQLALEITLRSARAHERDTFACEAAVSRLRERDRGRFAALLSTHNAAERV